jgi:Tfp pilus assembly protein PilX
MLNKLPASALEHRRGKRGVALIIVLAIVVILTGVIVAYFSRSIASRQIANSSANEEKVSLFAQAAANAIIGNLQQEIAEPALSSGTIITTGSVSSTIYIPKTAASMLPLLSGGVGTTATSPNLLILSGTGYFDGAAATIPINAVSISSTTQSLNSRYVSPQRWNAHYLLPLTANATDSTPAQGSFTPPNWVLVARNGTNPTSWSNNMVASPGNTNAVVGRYAYAIYHEGGLLDANVAGFPIGTGSAAVIANASYKPAMSYADLTQIPGLSATASDALVGWRNDASAQTPGASFLAPNFTGTSGSNYYAFVASDTTGFLRVSATNVNNNESDHRLGSRQELVRFIKNGLGLSGTSLNCLNYLATFTRDLNQPSLAPAPGRPTVLGTANGGNYELGSSSGIPGPGNDNLVNPIFLTVRVQTTIPGGRNDGSNLIQGEPLVKKRFSLRRLAWITYLGPSSGRSGIDITNLETNYGYAPTYLNQGTTATIQKYFGLTWNTGGYWVYDVRSGGSGIRRLDEVMAQNREPDFFELLKAAITAGSLGKWSAPPGNLLPYGAQYTRDSSIDVQVIQIGANIIDQANVSGYPTRIQFPAYKRVIRGVKNLPYLYRTRNVALVITNPAVKGTAPINPYMQKQTSGLAISNSGTVILVQEPEIWNPHNYNPSNLNGSLGNPRPTLLRLYAFSGAPVLPPSQPDPSTGYYVRNKSDVVWSTSVFRTLTGTTSEMDFANVGNLYREPTLLVKAGPNGAGVGSNLSAPGFQTACSADGLNVTTNGIKVDGTFGSSVPATPAQYGGNEPAPVGYYVGIYMGQGPALWNVVAASSTTTYAAASVCTNNNSGSNFASNSFPEMTYQVLCDNPVVSGSFEVYDEKFCVPANECSLTSTGASLFRPDDYPYQMLGWAKATGFFDPRTSRFGGHFIRVADNGWMQNEFPPCWQSVTPSPGPQWIDMAHNILPTMRPDNNAGYGIVIADASGPPDSAGGPAGNQGWSTWGGAVSDSLRYGLFAQNSATTNYNNGVRFTGDPYVTDTKAQYYEDPDGVVRRGMAANANTTVSLPNGAIGQPLATSFYNPLSPRQQESRPIILNRPFSTVAELGYVFSDTPWKNLDLSTPESGFAPLLDVFCINDTDNTAGLVAGKANLNSAQPPVLRSILNGAYKDEYNGAATPLSPTEAQTFASALVAKTGTAALMNVSGLVGTWMSGSNYDGFSASLSSTDVYTNNISRYREASIRALTASGQTRVWNLMIDVVAQTGRYPQNASGASNPLAAFLVEGEQRYWIHVAIDRLTGQVIDKQIELVKE